MKLCIMALQLIFLVAAVIMVNFGVLLQLGLVVHGEILTVMFQETLLLNGTTSGILMQ